MPGYSPPSSGGAPTTVDYLVGQASGDLSAEIVVGTAPGGELGGTWAAPTVDATHSGSAHHTNTQVGHGAWHGDATVTTHHTAFVQADHDALANPHHSNANDHAQLHATAHEPAGGDAMAVDAAVGTGSLRTLGTGALTAAVGSHTTPAMTATVAGHVPTPPNNTTDFLRGDGTFAVPSVATHGTGSHTDRAQRSQLGGMVAPSGASLTTLGARPNQASVLALTVAAGDDGIAGIWQFRVPDDYVSGGTFNVALCGDGSASANVVIKATAAVLLNTNLVNEAGQSATATVSISATNLAVAFANITPTITDIGAGFLVRVNITRLPADASDLYAGTVSLLNTMNFSYTADH